jgi:protoporphyrin/coproporphyrin ferrochelatase
MDAILLVSFGGPNAPADVMPFLENVTRGRGVPRERLEEVAVHYQHFGGKSPINEQNLALIAALQTQLAAQGPDLPIYFGNRNWDPFLVEAFRRMKHDGVRRVFAFVTSGFSCYSGCRQYRENIMAAMKEADAESMEVMKLRVFYNHPDFIHVMANNVRSALQQFAPEAKPALVFTAHSIPLSMARSSRYEEQLHEACRLTAEAAGYPEHTLVYQSRSGSAAIPWLEPDILDHMRALHAAGQNDLVIVPIGFVSDHMEVMFDLDEEAHLLAKELGMKMVRAATAGTDPRFVSMVRELVLERRGDLSEKRAMGQWGPSHDVCPVDCCPAPQRPAAAGGAPPSGSRPHSPAQ